MCLFSLQCEVDDIKKSKDNVITCYKILSKTVTNDGTINLSSPYYYMAYKPGLNLSDAKGACARKSKTIENGIHVYRTKEHAKKVCCSGQIVVEFTALKKDLLGANIEEMAFRKVELSEKEYKERTRNRKRAK